MKRTPLPVADAEVLPVLYGRWLYDVLGALPRRETFASCDDCAMVPSDSTNHLVRSFSAATKCCTYLPDIPNYLLGAILTEEEGTSGRASIRERLTYHIGVSPLGLIRTGVYAVIAGDDVGDAFGRSVALLCPHYLRDTGRCGIWRYRNAVCSTWFCKHNRGALGAQFWRDVQALLERVEQELAIWCCLEAGMSAQGLRSAAESQSMGARRRLVAELIGSKPNLPGSSEWTDRGWLSDEFYAGCYRRVAALAWSDVERVCGPAVAMRRVVVQDAFESLQHSSLPDTLVLCDHLTHSTREGQVSIVSYSRHNPLTIATAVAEHLKAFDGRPLDVVLSGLPSDVASEMQRDGCALLQRLRDHAILRPTTKT